MGNFRRAKWPIPYPWNSRPIITIKWNSALQMRPERRCRGKKQQRIPGSSLAEFFDYVYTTNAVDYSKYLGYAGLNIDLTPLEPAITHLDKSINKRSFKITPAVEVGDLQKKILDGWLR